MAHCAKKIFLLCFLGCGILQGCEFSRIQRGYAPNEAVVKTLTPGRSTKKDVVNILGSPSVVLVYNPNLWLYSKVALSTKSLNPVELKKANSYVLEFQGDTLKSITHGTDPFVVAIPKPYGNIVSTRRAFWNQIVPSGDFLRDYAKTTVTDLEPEGFSGVNRI